MFLIYFGQPGSSRSHCASVCSWTLCSLRAVDTAGAAKKLIATGMMTPSCPRPIAKAHGLQNACLLAVLHKVFSHV